MPYDYKGLAERLVAARGNISQSEAAKRTGMPQQYVSRHEGGSKVGVGELLAYACAYKVDLHWLMTGQGRDDKESAGQQDLAFGRDWIRLPAHDQRPLDGEEREQLERTITVLRCPPGCEEEPREAILPNINTLYRVTVRHIDEARRTKKGQVNGL
ncbi:helix-turn-helix domain-containing protein [Desulfarculus baarsii]